VSGKNNLPYSLALDMVPVLRTVYCYLCQLSNQHDLIPKFASAGGYCSLQKMVMVTHHKRDLETFLGFRPVV
jgi:hypothetical protein